MKRVMLFVITAALLISFASCTTEFSFRGSRFGDSMEQVKKAEGEGGESGEEGEYKSLDYEIEFFSGYTGSLTYYFKDDELEHIIGSYLDIHDNNKDSIENIYKSIENMFSKYGSPTKEEALEYTWYQALWEKDGYGICVLVNNGMISFICSHDPEKTKRFYGDYMYTPLFTDSDDSEVTRHVDGPDFYNDPYEISSFIPVPEEGYDYIVRDSISEEELSILKSNPSMQQLISAFGYPPMAEISKDSVFINGEQEDVKVFHLRYVVDDNAVGVIYDADCNLMKVSYNKPLNDISEASVPSIDKPVAKIRNDITRDELAFINSNTTPEQLQSVLGAPHRECYNAQLFRRIRYDYIRFFMSGHFLYPLEDGGVLDVLYTPGSGQIEKLSVSSATIYDDNGQATVLVR